MSDRSILQQVLLHSDGSGESSSGLTPLSLQKLGSDLETLIRIPDQEYSDLTIILDGKQVPIHRCILAARCPGIRKVFSEMGVTGGNRKLELEFSTIVEDGKIGYDAFMAVMSYVYSGKMELWLTGIACYDSTCVHITCRPIIDHVLEVLQLSLLLNLPEVTTVAEQHLIDHLENFQVDDMLHVYRSTAISECSELKSMYLTALASSSLDNLTAEKEFSGAALQQVRRFPKELRPGMLHLSASQEKQRKRIHRALDSDDIELVQLLLDEGKLDLNEACGLHYAAAYCHPRTLAHLLELDIADVNVRNERGMTVLHVAAWRRDPLAIAKLVEKGAQLQALTLDNQTALDISKRLTRKFNLVGEENFKDSLCVSILQQAERSVAVPNAAAAMLEQPCTEKDLMSKLLYLENRVALARLLYPREADIVMGISHLDSYATSTEILRNSSGSEITSRKRKSSVELNEEPTKRLAGLVGVTVADQSKENRLESLIRRCKTLQKAAEVARKYFPCYSAVIDKYVLDDDYVEPDEDCSVEDQLVKKKHFAELKGILQDCFSKGKVEEIKKAKKPIEKPIEEQRNPRTPNLPSSSSSTSSRGTSGSMISKV
ncbi:BTB/POZ domain and ankyrin repeat-containing protein NPR1 [Physcomitrium patens]|uniref:BTB domain-containing protein n=1 Tax=Physcomitrium patens TaxID=3218 RepID=A0A2K1IXL3_PHYPA|nr:BTB/POZ domain and ankyrin repeat-containing protein NPR2-like [Physcomitrium patens]XP_024403981.1 BTB/POZ domain and ankyrin repeat-containing protein NPR2-like [Physcomitrium patens]PNR34020.1 hypothetical protein PHYPA_023836 [Physcomitrium patens]|eukprot:XP_024403980.1 BTB/POZ domain and ankyrin repeat-containing protein NPR2-like [Physcomitrella patens]